MQGVQGMEELKGAMGMIENDQQDLRAQLGIITDLLMQVAEKQKELEKQQAEQQGEGQRGGGKAKKKKKKGGRSASKGGEEELFVESNNVDTAEREAAEGDGDGGGNAESSNSRICGTNNGEIEEEGGRIKDRSRGPM